MKYKIIKEFVMNGVTQKADTIIELTQVQEKLQSIKPFLEKLSVEVPATVAPAKSTDKTVLGSVVPGEVLTPEQKEKLAKENVELSTEAHRQAGEQRAKDQAEGKGEPAVKTVADLLKTKLENEEFEKKPE